MTRFFELACFPEWSTDVANLKAYAERNGWVIKGVETFTIANGSQAHYRFLCDHDWRDVRELAANAGYVWIDFSVRPINIYDGERIFRDGRGGEDEYYDYTIPSIQLVNGADIVWTQPLEATVPPLYGHELKERALQQGLASLTFLSGTPLEDEDSIVAPAIDREDAYRHPNWPGWMPECPGHVVFNCERAKKMRLRGKQSPENLYNPY